MDQQKIKLTRVRHKAGRGEASLLRDKAEDYISLRERMPQTTDLAMQLLVKLQRTDCDNWDRKLYLEETYRQLKSGQEMSLKMRELLIEINRMRPEGRANRRLYQISTREDVYVNKHYEARSKQIGRICVETIGKLQLQYQQRNQKIRDIRKNKNQLDCSWQRSFELNQLRDLESQAASIADILERLTLLHKQYKNLLFAWM